MKTKVTNGKRRTREEILAWLNRARLRKEAKEKQIRAEWEERQVLKRQAEESHYLDLEWM
jgi:hypothetical protein